MRQRKPVLTRGRKIAQALNQRQSDSSGEQPSQDQDSRQQHESDFHSSLWFEDNAPPTVAQADSLRPIVDDRPLAGYQPASQAHAVSTSIRFRGSLRRTDTSATDRHPCPANASKCGWYSGLRG